MTQIAECGSAAVKANPSKDTIVCEGVPVESLAKMVYGKVRLVHRSAGWTCAGSMMRLQEYEVWGVVFDCRSGGMGGQWFKNEADALDMFEKRTVR